MYIARIVTHPITVGNYLKFLEVFSLSSGIDSSANFPGTIFTTTSSVKL